MVALRDDRPSGREDDERRDREAAAGRASVRRFTTSTRLAVHSPCPIPPSSALPLTMESSGQFAAHGDRNVPLRRLWR